MNGKTTAAVKRIARIAGVIFIIIITVVVIKKFPVERMRAAIDRSGSLAPLVYISLFMITPIFFIPVFAYILAAGLLFGLMRGILYTLIGCILNCTIMFYLTRCFFSARIRNFLSKHLSSHIQEKIFSSDQEKLAVTFFILRLLPFVSYSFINYAAGLTEINFFAYLLSTVLGIMPGLLIFLNIGDKAIDQQSPEFIMAIFFLIVLAVISIIIAKIFFKKCEKT